MEIGFQLKYKGTLFHANDLKSTETEKGLVYVLEDGVKITLEKKEYKEFDAVEWVLYFENTSDTDSGILSEIDDCHITLPLPDIRVARPGFRTTEGNLVVTTMRGMVDGNYYWESDRESAEEYGLHHEYLDKAPNKTKRFANTGGRSSQEWMPFFDINSGENGYLMAIGWTGDWRSEFTATPGGVTIRSGLKETHFYLHSGEKIRTTSTLFMKYKEGEEKHNKFRRLIKTHISHKSTHSTQRHGLLAFELWGGLTSGEMIKRLRELHSHGIRFEDVWIDAGWYGECTKCDDAFTGDWSKCTGDWNVNTRVHPDGLREVMECAEERGMHLMLWFEPERALATTKFVKEHPDGLLSVKGNSQYIVNYGNADALAYTKELLLSYARGLRLSCYRQDFNIDLTNYFASSDTPERRGITEIKHICGMYELWDTLQNEFPELIIDNCSSGGRRIDIETLKRSIPFFRSDYQCNFNENPEVLQVHNAGSSLYLPYVGCTTKTKRDTYAIRSAYQSSFGGAFYNAIFQDFNEEDFQWAKTVTDEYRRIRDYFHEDFYSHGSNVFDSSSWAIFQYHNPKTQSGIVMAFRRENSPFRTVEFSLGGFREKRELIFENLNTGESFQGTSTLTIDLPEKRSSVIFEYKTI